MTAGCVVIAPHEELARLARQVCRETGSAHEVVTCNTVPIAVEMAKKFVADGARVIVSRSTIARVISENVPIPVIPIEITFMDLVDTLTRVRHLGKKIAVMIGPELDFDMERVRTLLGVAAHHISVPAGGNLVDTVAGLKETGFDLVVGGAVAGYFAEAAGLRVANFESGRESVRAALARAEELLRLDEPGPIADSAFGGILDGAREGILITDAADRVQWLNASAAEMLGASRAKLAGKPCRDALPFLPSRSLAGPSCDWCKVNGSPLLQNSAPYFRDGEPAGAVSFLYNAKLRESFRHGDDRELHLKGHVAQYTFANIITKNPQMRRVIERAQSFSQVDSTILITGETGTGKELFAQGIHNAGARRKHPFVAINCASIPDSILESELFGYEPGAFTGAAKGGKKGYFEMAEGGTLFLDEIGEIAPNLQSKLLRVLQQREIVRVGGDRVVPVDIRIIVATLADMEAEVQGGRFRRDLYYRLNVLRLSIPPLRERLEDLPPLIRELAGKIAGRLRLPKIRLEDGMLEKFAAYPWFGNVRELENALERLTILNRKGSVNADELDTILEDMRMDAPEPDEPRNLAELEKGAILDALRAFGWDRGKACAALGISQATLWRRLKEWGIQTE